MDLLSGEIEIDDTLSYPPFNYSWVVENELAAMGCPRSVENLRFLHEEGIRHLVTVSAERIPPIEDFPQLDWTNIPIQDLETPTLKEIVKFIDVCERSRSKKYAVGVHCRMGRGRSGVMAACYLVKFQHLTPEKAVTNVRLLRPGSVELPEQERAVMKYFDLLRGTKTFELEDIGDDETLLPMETN